MVCSACGKDVEAVDGKCPECGAGMNGGEEREITAKIDTEALRKEWEARADHARGITLVTSLAARTDLGRLRENNEDKFEFFVPEDEDTLARKGAFYAVADGMGGHAAGQIASEIALKAVIGNYYADSSPDVEKCLRAAVSSANAVIYDAARAIVERSGMGTTLTGLVLRGDESFVVHVGDSRCYRLRAGTLEQLTEDHSWVNEQVQRGGMSREEAENSPFRNIITRSLGNYPTVEPDIVQDELREGDVFLLCSDGLTGEVSDDLIRDTLKDSCAARAAWDLVELALEHGGRDNVTVLVVAVREIMKKQRRRRGFALFGRD